MITSTFVRPSSPLVSATLSEIMPPSARANNARRPNIPAVKPAVLNPF